MIRLSGLTKTYRMGESVVAALRGVDLHIRRGSYVAIMGPSGSGKSTLMNILGCLDRPSDGRYVLDGEDVSRLSDDALARIRNRKIGFVFQSFNLLHHATAVENVALPLVYAGADRQIERARAALRKVALEARGDHKPTEMSGGQRQRVAIARAIITEPPLILADEPTGNLDSQTSEEILDIFAALHRSGSTIVMVTHERDVAEHAQRIITFRDGRLISDESLADESLADGSLADGSLADGSLADGSLADGSLADESLADEGGAPSGSVGAGAEQAGGNQ